MNASISYVSWMEHNCFYCKKYDKDEVHPDICPIDEAITLYAVGGIPIPDEIAKRAGLPGYRCLEIEKE